MEAPPENADSSTRTPADTAPVLMLHMPEMHPDTTRALCAHTIAENVRFFSPGLAGTDDERFFVSPALPFIPATAQHCLHDMLEFGQQVSHARELGAVARETEAREQQARELKQEMAAIARFESTADGASAQPSGASAGASPNAFRDASSAQEAEKASAERAQKVLILAWNLEERVAELDLLETQLADTHAALSAMIGNAGIALDDAATSPAQKPSAGYADITDPSELHGMGDSVSRMAWYTVFDAMLRFAPADMPFTTAHSEVIARLQELGAATPDPDAAHCFHAVLPAWKLLGHTRVPQERPWLDRAVTIYFSAAEQP